MQTVTVGTKYQIVIPKEVRKKVKGLMPGSKVSVQAIDEETMKVKAKPKSWVEESYGFMKDAWENIDPIVELEKMRNEWENKYQKK